MISSTMMAMTQLVTQLVFLLVIFHYSIATDTLNPNQPLRDDQALISGKEIFALGFFSPGRSKNRYVGIWYNKLQPAGQKTIVWVANRRSPLSGTNGSLELNGNGSLTINSMIFLPMPMVALTNPVAQLLDDGNFVIREANSSEFAWQSFDYPTDTLLSGMKLGWDLRTGLNRNVTAWRSYEDPSPGSYALSIDLEGIPQANFWSGSTKKWRSGPWIGIQFSNAGEQPSNYGLRFDFVHNKDEVYYMYNTTGTNFVRRALVDQSGKVKDFVWIERTGRWNHFLDYPINDCHEYSKCGPYGVCNLDVWPICRCLQGFKPKSPQEWPLMDTSSGCDRLTALDCKNRSDGFMAVTIAALPETLSTILYTNISQNECRDRCLKNCSCTAYATANISGAGLGCVIWVTEIIDLRMSPNPTQDVFVRLAAADLDVRGNGEFELAQLQWSTLMEATHNFAKTNILGKGGFGLVYKGKLAEGREIAVKRLSRNSTQGIDEFENEVTFIAKLQHRNLVRLLGYCIKGDEKILVYEYMPNGSLDPFLFDKEKGDHLDWQTRFHIIEGIARGLLYLHQDSRLRIIHRDLKASNILLDIEMNPKISDFGLARNFGDRETMIKTRKVVGTYGYMAPEYALDGVFSMKSDVFSFGVLILEIISGQRNRVFLSSPHLYLLGKAWRLWNDGKGLDFLDPLIGNSFSMTQVMRCINIGLLCVQEKPEDRPIMSSVVIMLGNDDAPLLEPKEPGFKAIFSPKHDAALNQNELHTFNDITLTEQTGR
ncbi:G-type lectin S-receptor-like serine/threonine-protein kinase At4g27290 isoform X2 [Dioscorea cayenensis subsp. rotundata]|uniref:Receptor-like serine/threonine-protein kinase n=1 Tax=Dioscorea cayennensis subsp. rotundata TaxID=55577 RepID=A0AB40CIC4_DIOCR|nr:G-type lectin S-receptor-like serine/threonine-protein kinase At4g27290 isoform X2 [Dioscorea cayenensis subsp. rotundata]